MRHPSLILAGLLLAAGCASAQNLNQYVIERNIPGAGKMTPEQLSQAAAKSNAVLRALGPDIQWVHSYVAGDKLYCVYNAPNEEMIRTHAQRSGFPADRISRVSAVIDPTTAH